MSAVIGIAIILAVIGLAIWAANRSGKPGGGGNGDNRESAIRLGSGYHGP